MSASEPRAKKKSRRTGKADLPNPQWSDERLEEWAISPLNASLTAEAESIRLGRDSALSRYRAGMALSILRDRLKPRHQWMAWQRQQRLKQTVVLEAITLYEKASAEGGQKVVRNLTLTKARARWVRPGAKDWLSQHDEDTVRLALIAAGDQDR